jgi:hypothetical protein
MRLFYNCVCFCDSNKGAGMTDIGRKAEQLQMGRKQPVCFCAWIDD